jgi:hypothetical protein
MTYKTTFGSFRLLLGIALLGSVVWQITDRIANNLFRPLEYFTYLSIDSAIYAGVVLLFSGALLLNHKRETVRLNVIRLGATVAMIVVGAGYHLFLGDESGSPLDVGYDWPVLPNLIIHTYAPILVTLDYLFSVKGPKPSLSKAPWLLIFPLIWITYSIIRGSIDDVWPYWFLNPEEVGVGGVAIYIIGFAIFGLGLGFTLLVLRRLMQKITGH